MNSLKTVLIVIVLAVVAGAVYVLVNNNSTPAPPPDMAEGWTDPLTVEIPDPGTSQSPFDTFGGSTSPGSSPGGPGGLAPPFSAERSSDQALW